MKCLVLKIGFVLSLSMVPSLILGEETQNSKEVWMQAGEQALTHPVVAVALYGRTSDATQQQIADFYRTKYAGNNVPVEFFFADEEQIGASVSFFLRDVSYGPTKVSESSDHFNDTVKHFPQAWPEYKNSK